MVVMSDQIIRVVFQCTQGKNRAHFRNISRLRFAFGRNTYHSKKVSHEKTWPSYPLYCTGLLIGIPIMADYNPYLVG